MKNDRNIALDGIRGIAILSVVFFHATMTLGHHWWPIQWLLNITQAGWLGVDIFFALSGYLITGILWQSKAEQPQLGAYLSRFYYRRILRIFPLYFGVLIVLLVIPQMVTALQDANYARFVDMQPWFWLHAANMAREVYGWTSPALEFGHIELTHFWSLSVEEHFYFVWPLVLFFMSRRAVLTVCVILVCVSVAIKLNVLNLPPLLAATPKHLAGLAIGSAAALCPQLFGRKVLMTCIAIFLCGVVWLGVSYETSWAFSPLTAAIAASICVAVKGTSNIYSAVLSNRVLTTFGKYSYGIYVYHSLFGPMLRDLRLDTFPGGYSVGAVAYVAFYLTVPLAVSVVSFNYFESRFLELKDKRATL